MMTAESMLSKRPVRRFTAALVFLLQISPVLFLFPRLYHVDEDIWRIIVWEEVKVAMEQITYTVLSCCDYSIIVLLASGKRRFVWF